MKASSSVYYSDEYFVQPTQAAYATQDSFTKYDARVAVADAATGSQDDFVELEEPAAAAPEPEASAEPETSDVAEVADAAPAAPAAETPQAEDKPEAQA